MPDEYWQVILLVISGIILFIHESGERFCSAEHCVVFPFFGGEGGGGVGGTNDEREGMRQLNAIFCEVQRKE